MRGRLVVFGCMVSTLYARQDSFFGLPVSTQFSSHAIHPQSYDPTVPPSSLVWPPPRSMVCEGSPMSLHPDFAITTVLEGPAGLSSVQSNVLDRIVGRYNGIIKKKRQGQREFSLSSQSKPMLTELRITIDANNRTSDIVGSETRYGYSLDFHGGNVGSATAESIYGAQYALESFVQLLSRDCRLLHSKVHIEDSPQYQWRGLMIDAGRRFFPVPLVENLLDTMAATKLNVLHLHASDMCRFGVESKKFPNLTESLTGIHAGFYTQEDIKALQQYAKERGIRVVPEFDIPGHSRGYIPVGYGPDGVQFCEADSPSRSQLYGDPAGKTYAILQELMAEMSGLFEDEVFNIGCDETSVKGPCSINSTFSLERHVFNDIASNLKKTPEGWEEAYFDAQAATQNTIVNAWARHSAAEITSTGRRAVESKSSAFYFTRSVPGGPAGWDRCWYDISTNVAKDNLHLLLGGEMSMWSDTYCYINQCGAAGAGSPVGHRLFDPKLDAQFSRSIGGMIWPRGFVGAAAFWNFNASVKPDSNSFIASIYKMNDEVQSRGGFVCKTNCSCDQLSECGKPYLSYGSGSPVGIAPCLTSGSQETQQWAWDAATGRISLVANSSLCLGTSGHEVYPLTLQLCSSPDARNIVWTRGSEVKAQIVNKALNECLDLKKGADANDAVGTWACGSNLHLDQANQHWAFDDVTGVFASLAAGYQFDGQCLTVQQ